MTLPHQSFLSVVFWELYMELRVCVSEVHAQEQGLGLKEFTYAVEDAIKS